MADFTTEISDADLNRAIGTITRRLDSNGLQPVLQDLGEYLLDQVQTRFDTQTDPQGTPWADISPAWKTEKERRRGIPKILQFRGDLRRSIVYQVQASQRRVVIGSNLPYANIHQFGGEIQRTGRRKGPYTIRIDARPYLGLNAADRQEIIQIIRDHLAGIS
ncbi:phage virion morphogenesis protein [Vacuolonema iberomarrocanum]|uniref:phage virion morphogenesis protein n=1 Tax=Vacuolonema iberomarrocanum TaxID=3454632 RepID=UPI0019DA6B16|nr:phage virion morphogenesis protein [filamentous cyanobacterium LEGE 07170]